MLVYEKEFVLQGVALLRTRGVETHGWREGEDRKGDPEGPNRVKDFHCGALARSSKVEWGTCQEVGTS